MVAIRYYHFNPLPPHGGRRASTTGWKDSCTFQSTPSAWRETLRIAWYICMDAHFNPLPPHGGRPSADSSAPISVRFQSTPSAWRETLRHRMPSACHLHFNPLPPHGGRPQNDLDDSAGKAFQSTPSAWRETRYALQSCVQLCISIHSLRMEGDVGQSTPIQGLRDFNPLPPHGGRPVS